MESSANYKASRLLGFVGDFCGYYPSYNFLALTVRPPVSGCPQCAASSDNSFSFALGREIDFQLTKHLGIRGQADLFHNGFSSSDNQLTYKYHQWNARISMGVVFRF